MHLLNMSSFPEVFPGTRFHHCASSSMSRCCSKLKHAPKNWFISTADACWYFLRMYRCPPAISPCLMEYDWHALCHSNEKFPIKEAMHSWGRKGNNTATHIRLLHVCTHKLTTNQCEDLSPHLISSGLLNTCCLPYLQKGQVQNGSPGTQSTN